MASARASVRRALSTCRFSIMRPSTVTTPRPSAAAAVNASMTSRAAATSSSVGRPGVVGRLDLAGVDRASCRRSPSRRPGGTRRRSRRRRGCRCRPRRGSPCRPRAPRGTAVARYGVRLARPGTPSGARSSRARSLVPITSTLTRGWAAMARASKIAVGVSTMAQIGGAVAPAASSRGGDVVDVGRAGDLGDHHRRRARHRRRRRCRRRPTAWRGRCTGSPARRGRSRPTPTRGDGLLAGRAPWRRGRPRPRGRG